MNHAALVDSNVLLRLVQPAHTQYALAAAALQNLRQQNTDLCIVPQNLVEFWAVATRPIANNGLALNPAAAEIEIRRLVNLFRLLEGAPGIAHEWEKLVSRHAVSGKQAHDAHLVAAMAVYGVSTILTFNAEDFMRYGIEVVHPVEVA